MKVIFVSKNLTTFTKMLSMVVDIKSYQMVLSLTKKLKKKIV